MIVPLVVLVLGVGGFFLLRAAGDGSGPLAGIIGGHEKKEPDDTVPDFDFKVKSTEPIPTEAKANAGALKEAAGEGAEDVQAALTGLFREAFLDPANWREGDYDDVWALFDDSIASQAEKDQETLTLGADAGDRFKSVAPRSGVLKIDVLLDADGVPAAAVAKVKFSAKAKGKKAPIVMVDSRGQFFLHPGEGGWTVYAYSLDRNDSKKQRKAGQDEKPESGPSATPTGETP